MTIKMKAIVKNVSVQWRKRFSRRNCSLAKSELPPTTAFSCLLSYHEMTIRMIESTVNTPAMISKTYSNLPMRKIKTVSPIVSKIHAPTNTLQMSL